MSAPCFTSSINIGSIVDQVVIRLGLEARPYLDSSRPSSSVPQVAAEHRAYLARLLTGLLLSKRVGALRRLIELKALASQFAALSGRLAIDTEALALDTVDVATGASAPPSLATSTRQVERVRASLTLLPAHR